MSNRVRTELEKSNCVNEENVVNYKKGDGYIEEEKELNDFDQKWESLQIKNDYIFSKVMRNIEYAAKSVRLDVYVEEGNRVFNLEMQATSQSELPYRSRYYQGMIDLNCIEKGEDYDELKESYVIFICTFDPFEKRMAQYTFENLCEEDPAIRLNDGTKKIFFNSKSYAKAADEDVREFLRYVNGEKSENPFVQVIDNKVTKVKSSKEWRVLDIRRMSVKHRPEWNGERIYDVIDERP